MFDGTKCNSNQWWNNDKCQCKCKKHNVGEKDCVWNLATYNYKNGKYLASIMDDSAIFCNDVDNKTNFIEKKASCKIQNYYILPVFLLITIALLIAVSIYWYLIK